MNLLIHVVLFALLGFGSALAIHSASVGLVLVLAIVSELVQPWFGRICDPVDMAVNAVAGLVAAELALGGRGNG